MSVPGLLVERAGVHTTVQDAGRWGYQHLGVPVGGALDRDALRQANWLVGNAPDESVLEVTLVGCVLRSEVSMQVVVTGATFDLRVDGRDVAPGIVLALRPGQVLELGERRSGARAYVGVRGGLDAPVVLGSRSAWPLLPRRGALTDGTRLPVGTRIAGPVRAGAWPIERRSHVLRVLAGPDLPAAPQALAVLCATAYRVTAAASRMAYPLEGPAVPLLTPGRASSGTVTGAIQILPSGLPILLMAERPTTGGYPIAAVVITADAGAAAQLAPGDQVRFAPVDQAAAVGALLQHDSVRGDT